MRIAVVVATVCLSVLGLSAVTNAQAAIRRTTSIPAQGLGPALQAFAKERDFALVYRSELVRDLHSQGAAGELTAEEALVRLLAGTGLTFRFIDETTVTIVSSAGSDTQGSPLSTSSMGRALRLAQAETADSPAMSSETRDEVAAPLNQATELPRPEESGKAIPEMLVKGSRSLNTDIERTEDDILPYVVFDRAQIERSMSTSLNEFLRTRLPMNTVRSPANQGAQSSNLSEIDLRGLGSDQTLILLDGRRLPSGSNAGSFRQPDINAIPLAAIERIEILPSTASGIYGGGATGGVINIITRKDYTGVQLGATYEDTFETDAPQYRLDLSAGLDLEGGRTSILFVASHSESDPLLAGDRDFGVRGRALQLANNPEGFYSLSTPPHGYTSNIRSQNGTNLVLDDGTPLNSPRTYVPVGYAGVASDGGEALVANAGQYNLDLPDDLFGNRQSLMNHPTVSSATLNVRRSFGANLDAFVDMSWLENKGEARFANVPNSVTLPAGAPNNPFTTAVVVRFPVTGLSFPLLSESETLRGVTGAILRLPGDWTAAADFAWSRSRLSTVQTFPAYGDPDGTGPGISGATALADGTLDVMRDLNSFPLDYSPYLLPSPNSSLGPADTVLRDATLRLSGTLFELPGGPLTISGLIARREETAEKAFSSAISASNVTFVTLRPERSQDATSFYVEANAALLSARNDVPLVHDLELQASIRRDEYRTRSSNPTAATAFSREGPFPPFTYEENEFEATKRTIGLSYSPISDVILRASYGTGFLPASVSQITPGNPFPLTLTLADPRRGGIAVPVGPFLRQTGGNPNLIPEESDSWSAGLVLTPRFIEGLRLSVDYTIIEKTNEIGSLSTQVLLDSEDIFPGRIVRDPLTPEDAALGYTGGVITSIDNTFLNFARARVEAYDFQADYTLRSDRLGTLSFYAIATWEPHFERQTLPQQPFVDSVGFTSGPLEWRGNAGLNWEIGPWNFGWAAQHYGSHYAYSATATQATIASTTLSQGSSKIQSQTYHDVMASYRFDEHTGLLSGALADTEIFLGIQNVFDKSPPILASTGFTNAAGGYSTYGDPRLRRYSLTIRKNF